MLVTWKSNNVHIFTVHVSLSEISLELTTCESETFTVPLILSVPIKISCQDSSELEPRSGNFRWAGGELNIS